MKRFKRLLRTIYYNLEPRLIYEPTWKEEISCRYYYILMEFCDTISGGKHFWRDYDHHMFGKCQRCSFCRTVTTTLEQIGEAQIGRNKESVNGYGSSGD